MARAGCSVQGAPLQETVRGWSEWGWGWHHHAPHPGGEGAAWRASWWRELPASPVTRTHCEASAQSPGTQAASRRQTLFSDGLLHLAKQVVAVDTAISLKIS